MWSYSNETQPAGSCPIGQMPDPNNGGACSAPQCGSNQTYVGSSCQNNTWCSGPPKGFVSANVTCPTIASYSPSSPQSMAVAGGTSTGAKAGAQKGAVVASGGGTPAQAVAQGQKSGAGAAAGNQAASGGASQSQQAAVSSAAETAAENFGSSAAVFSATEAEALAQGLSAAQAIQIALAASAGFEAGGSTALQSYTNTNNGANYVTSSNCSIDGCDFRTSFSCPSGTIPRDLGGGSFHCIPNPTAPACDPSNIASCDVPDCSFGTYNGSECVGEIGVSSCPANYIANVDGLCLPDPSVHSTDDAGEIIDMGCPSGYIDNGAGCSLKIDSVSTTVNSDGSISTTYGSSGSTSDSDSDGESEDDSVDTTGMGWEADGDGGVFDHTEIDSQIASLKVEISDSVGRFEGLFDSSLNLSSSGSLPCLGSFDYNGNITEICLQPYEEHLSKIAAAILLLSAFISIVIIFR